MAANPVAPSASLRTDAYAFPNLTGLTQAWPRWGITCTVALYDIGLFVVSSRVGGQDNLQ